MRSLLRVSLAGWALLSGAALVAMVIGHALELWFENLHVFGDARAAYVHQGQTLCIELAGAALLVVVVVVAGRLIRAASDHGPADAGLATIAAAHPTAIAMSVLGIQFGSLIAVELTEQALSSFAHPSLWAIFGSGHATALFVHSIIGFVIAGVICAFARAVTARQRAWAGIVATFLRRASQQAPQPPRFSRRYAHRDQPRLAVLALRIANRPPPHFAHV